VSLLFLHLIISIPINFTHNLDSDQLHVLSYFKEMMFSSSASRFVLLLSSAFSAVSSAGGIRGTAVVEQPVNLLSAENYVILTKSGISTVPDSVITGDIAVSPIAATAITGFSLTMDSGNEFSKSAQVVGKAFAATYAPPIPAHLSTAVSEMEAAYTDAAGRPNADADRKNIGEGVLGGDFGGPDAPLTPGVYTFGSGVTIGGDITFEGTGIDTEDVFIIQITGKLIQTANIDVTLSNGALAKNIFWQVADEVLVGKGAHLQGILLAQTSVLFETGSSLNGRVLAQTACDLQVATITEPAGQ
jgi:hypothetical protein